MGVKYHTVNAFSPHGHRKLENCVEKWDPNFQIYDLDCKSCIEKSLLENTMEFLLRKKLYFGV